jgi:hypothetical protein
MNAITEIYSQKTGGVNMLRNITAIALAAALGLSTLAAQESKKPPTPAKLDLTPQTFAKLHTLLRPHENEWRHLKVNWLTDVVAARKQAAAEDKPIVICYTGGAGYNEPLGVC